MSFFTRKESVWGPPCLRERCECTPVLTHTYRDCQTRTAPTSCILEVLTHSNSLGTHKVTTIPTGMEDGPEVH